MHLETVSNANYLKKTVVESRSKSRMNRFVVFYLVSLIMVSFISQGALEMAENALK